MHMNMRFIAEQNKLMETLKITPALALLEAPPSLAPRSSLKVLESLDVNKRQIKKCLEDENKKLASSI